MGSGSGTETSDRVALTLGAGHGCPLPTISRKELPVKVFRWLWLPLLLIPLVLSSCQQASDGSKDKDRQYDVKAKVVAVDLEKKTVTLDHEDIPGLMKAMEMKFPVEDAKVLEGIKPGDQVHGRLKVKSGDNVITELHKR